MKAYITYKKFDNMPDKSGWWIWVHKEFDIIGSPVSGPYLDKAEALMYYRQLPDSIRDETLISQFLNRRECQSL